MIDHPIPFLAAPRTDPRHNEPVLPWTWLLMIALVICFLAVAKGPAMADCAGGPDFCQNDPRIPNALAAKKQSLMASGYPTNLVALLDIGPQCVARIERSPDAFSLWIVNTDGSKESAEWSVENQTNTMKQVNAGEVARFWIVNARRAFSCFGEPPYDHMADYDTTDDVNTSRAIRCNKNSPC